MPDKSVLETLVAARKLIEDPLHWTQAQFARTIADRQRIPWVEIAKVDPAMCSFCALGACWRAREKDYTYEDEAALQAVMGDAVGEFNDTHTHAEVLAAFDAAIAEVSHD